MIIPASAPRPKEAAAMKPTVPVAPATVHAAAPAAGHSTAPTGYGTASSAMPAGYSTAAAASHPAAPAMGSSASHTAAPAAHQGTGCGTSTASQGTASQGTGCGTGATSPSKSDGSTSGAHTVPVHFEFSHPTATTVCIAGSFNHWDARIKPMHAMGGGHWRKEAVLEPGTYEYCLVVDGRWMPDPLCHETVVNPFGGRNSILRVGHQADHLHGSLPPAAVHSSAAPQPALAGTCHPQNKAATHG